jgi:hypothetical protein
LGLFAILLRIFLEIDKDGPQFKDILNLDGLFSDQGEEISKLWTSKVLAIWNSDLCKEFREYTKIEIPNIDLSTRDWLLEALSLIFKSYVFGKAAKIIGSREKLVQNDEYFRFVSSINHNNIEYSLEDYLVVKLTEYQENFQRWSMDIQEASSENITCRYSWDELEISLVKHNDNIRRTISLLDWHLFYDKKPSERSKYYKEISLSLDSLAEESKKTLQKLNNVKAFEHSTISFMEALRMFELDIKSYRNL